MSKAAPLVVLLAFVAGTKDFCFAREFQILVQPGDIIDDRVIRSTYIEHEPPIVINDLGEVFFSAEYGHGEYGLFTLDRFVSPPSLVDAGFGEWLFDGEVGADMNNFGDVAVVVDRSDDSRFVLVNDTTLVELGNDVGGFEIIRFDEAIRIDDLGGVVFGATAAPRRDGYFTAERPLVLEGDVVRDTSAQSYRVRSLTSYGVNGRGEIAFSASSDDFEGSLVVTGDEVRYQTGDVVDGSSLGQLRVEGFNSSGRILMRSNLDSIFLGDEKVVTVGNVLDGRTIDFIGSVRVNDINDVGFGARTETGGTLFLDGATLLTDGDTIGASQIVGIMSFDVNNRRDVVVSARLDDGSAALVVSYGPDLDFDSNGTLDVADADALVREISSASNSMDFDLSEDGAVNTDDLARWLINAGITNLESKSWFRFGDANLDGFIDPIDLNQLGENWLATGSLGWSQGDFTADGRIDALDLNQLAVNWDAEFVASSAPEPRTSTISILIVLVSLRKLLSRRSYIDRRV